MLKKIHHVAVVVRSADTALQFYCDSLGLPVTKDAVIEEQGVRGVLLQCGHSEIELIEPVRPDTGVARFLATKGEGAHHICFETDDVAAELARAEAKGLALIDRKPRTGLAGQIGFLHPRATHGVLIEYAQPPADAAGHPGQGAGWVQDLDHIVVAVSDLEAGVQTYAHNFDLACSQTGELTMLRGRKAILPIGPAFIELAMLSGEAGPLDEFLGNQGEGIYLVALRMDDLPPAVRRLRERGAQVSEPLGAGAAPPRQLAVVAPRSTHGLPLLLIA